MVLANLLVEELKTIGMSDASVDEFGYVMATLPANTDKKLPTIGFLAHIDTASEFTATNVNPQIVDYKGGDIVLNEALNVVLTPTAFPEMPNYEGHTLMTTDGTTLLGADNKAGIAEIMTAMDYLLKNPEIKHGKIRVAFTPDEEIGRGPHRFDVAAFNADFAYTVDGGPLGELQYESFNAAHAKLFFQGVNTHPGTAKNKMIHAAKLAMEFHSHLPNEESPEFTDGYQGFYHLINMNAEVEKAESYYIIRDFDKESFQKRKAFIEQIAETLQNKYGKDRIQLELDDQYYNMADKILPVREIVDVAEEAMKNLGIVPKIGAIRGGTDGSQLSYMGLPTPNIFTGGENFHGKFEYVSIDDMEKSVNTIVEIIRLFEKKA
ncbi:MAG: peptidase T, partial [Turicibacter sp.]|nr:peptidase T [Turicibacter sp.]